MTDRVKLAVAYAALKQGTLWKATGRCKGFAASNIGEAAKLDAYVAALAAGDNPMPPVLATPTGKGLVGIIGAGVTPPGSFFAVDTSLVFGSTLSEPLVWSARTSPLDVEVARVEFFVDGVLRWTENTAPYVFNGDAGKLDPATLQPGRHFLKVVATAKDGRIAEVYGGVTVR